MSSSSKSYEASSHTDTCSVDVDLEEDAAFQGHNSMFLESFKNKEPAGRKGSNKIRTMNEITIINK